MVSVTEPLALTAGTKVGAEAPPRSALMLASVPERTSDPVPDPVTVTPPPEAAVSVPDPTLSVTDMVPLAASMSAMARPESWTPVSSLVVNVAGSVLTGASLTGVMVMLRVSISVSVPPEPVLPPSLVVMVRTTVPLALATGV